MSEQRHCENLEVLKQLVARCEEVGYYGSIQLKFESGKITHAELAQTVRVSDLLAGSVRPLYTKGRSGGETQTSQASVARSQGQLDQESSSAKA